MPNSKSSLGDLNPSTAVTSDLWGAPKSRGPPPGLTSKGSSSINGWGSNLGGPNSAAPYQARSNWTSQWLLLKNLTAQVSLLKNPEKYHNV